MFKKVFVILLRCINIITLQWRYITTKSRALHGNAHCAKSITTNQFGNGGGRKSKLLHEVGRQRAAGTPCL